MGRVGAGVEVRAKSIRFTFVPGKPTLMVNGTPAPPTPANVKWAHRLAAEIRERMRHGTFSMLEYFPASGATGAPLTLAVQLQTWLDAQRVEKSTRAGYVAATRFWCSAVDGETVLRALKHSAILKAVASRPDLSGKTVNNYVSVLRQALDLAVREKALAENPADGVPRATWQREPPDPFSREEAEAIIAAMPEGQVRNMVEWRFFTGVRTSEMAGLAWSAVDLATGYVRIEQALVLDETKPTKTGVVRDVLLNSRARAALTRQKAHTFLADGPVWNDPRYDAPWSDERAFRRSYWTPALKRLGIRYRKPNQARHTYATMMLMAGMTPAFAAKQLGHSVEMFLRTYSKWLNGGQNALEMARLETALLGEETGEVSGATRGI